MKYDLNVIEDHLGKIESYVSKSPSSENLNECDLYFQKIRSAYALLAHHMGILEAVYAMKAYESIKGMSESEYKRIKNSSTISTTYLDGLNPRLTLLRKKAAELKILIRQSSDELRTLISFRKEEMHIANMKINQQ